MKKRFAGLLAAVLVGFGGAAASAQASYNEIRNYGSGLCAGLNWWEYNYDGASVVQQTCDGSPEQRWAEVPLGGGVYRFVNGRNGKCMDVRDARDADSQPVQVWSCSSSRGMLWRVPYLPAWGPVQIRSALSGGRCLDVRSGSLQPGAVIQIYRCTSNNPAQLWTVHA